MNLPEWWHAQLDPKFSGWTSSARGSFFYYVHQQRRDICVFRREDKKWYFILNNGDTEGTVLDGVATPEEAMAAAYVLWRML